MWSRLLVAKNDSAAALILAVPALVGAAHREHDTVSPGKLGEVAARVSWADIRVGVGDDTAGLTPQTTHRSPSN
jgi:hypothetical protein